MKFKIDKNVPIPERFQNATTNSLYKKIVEKLQIGDSVGGLTQSQANSLVTFMKKQGKKATSRKVDSRPSRDAEYRIWYVGDRTPETKVIPDTALPAENVCSCDNDIMKEAELHEDDKNIVEDMYEVNKIINQEFNLINKKEK
jgi:hypothetical protein